MQTQKTLQDYIDMRGIVEQGNFPVFVQLVDAFHGKDGFNINGLFPKKTEDLLDGGELVLVTALKTGGSSPFSQTRIGARKIFSWLLDNRERLNLDLDIADSCGNYPVDYALESNDSYLFDTLAAAGAQTCISSTTLHQGATYPWEATRAVMALERKSKLATSQPG